ncbi:MAG: hypothetical protein KJ060_08055 [Candidatus Hydrogenedentes bacterium]|nr:hypothetical protein [Candidatus Hydrogenedentota bacterium]
MSRHAFVFATRCIFAIALPFASAQESTPPESTSFQVSPGYRPELDIGSDMAIVYGTNGTFAERADSWREQGYTISLMTGIAWGAYGSYYGSGDAFKKEEVQTAKDGRLFMHGHSTTVGYNVPTDAYVEYIKQYIDPALDYGVHAVFLEEPEFWANTGWSEAFKREWQEFYSEPWQEPDSSPDAQYRASKLKYELYFDALREVFAYVDERAREKGIDIECHVPTHSLVNYAQWRIVSPESHLIDIPQLDGYIAQVWTGTARSQNAYQGVRKERTFETAYLEYGQMLAMVRPTGREVWFLADPVEDNPNRSWNDYKLNYECTVIASLMWPEVSRFEVMPWPDRIFQGTYPKVDMDSQSGDREGIPSDYATQLLTVINALNDMDQPEVQYETGTQGIGVVVSDTMMFQRAAPEPSEASLGSFYALSLPLLKVGVPVEIAQLENTIHSGSLDRYKVLLLTYEHQKPLKPEYHAALDAWVRAGGCLIVIDDGSDPYHHVREWWNDQGKTDAKAYDDLFRRLGVTAAARTAPEAVEDGFVRVVEERPRDLQESVQGAENVRRWVREVLEAKGESLETQVYLCVRRGPYVIASVLDETLVEDPEVRFTGQYIDLFDPALPVVHERVLRANERTLLVDADWIRSRQRSPAVLAAAARVRDARVEDGAFRFTMRGPSGTTARARVLLPVKPEQVTFDPDPGYEYSWDAESSTLLLMGPNVAQPVHVAIGL